MTTGELIKERRSQLDMTADELADRVGISRSTMFRYERGAITKIPYTRLSDIAKVLRTTPETLMGEGEGNAATVSEKNANEASVIIRSLSPEKQEMALSYLHFLAANDK